MSLINSTSTQHHSMFLETESNRGFDDQLGGMIGGKTVHEAPVRELVETEVGQLVNDSKVDSKEDEGSSSGAGVGKGRKKVILWTDDEHLKFLQGLKKFGKGAWDRISKEAVITKTPKQVTSHAQKYFLRQDNTMKKRRSIHDVTLVDVQAPTTSSPSYGSQPMPSIQAPLATAGFNDTIVKAGKGVLSTPYHPNYLHDYYTVQPHPVTLPMSYYCQVDGEASAQPLFNLYDRTQGQPLPMNYDCQVAGEASHTVFNLYDHSQGGEVQPPVGASLYDYTGKGKGVVAESASNLSCDHGHYYNFGRQAGEGPQPLPMNYSFSGGQAAGESLFNFYDSTQGEPLPMNNYCQAPHEVFNLYDNTQGGGEEVQPPLGTSLYDIGPGEGEITSSAPYLYDGQCFGGQGEAGPQPLPMNYSFSGGQVVGESSAQPLFNLYNSTQGEPLPMNYCPVGDEAPQAVFNLDDTTQAGGGWGTTFCDDDETITWLLNEYSSYDNNSCYHYSSDCY